MRLALVSVGCGVACFLLNVLTYGFLGDANLIQPETLESRALGRVVRLLLMTIGFVFSWCGGFGLHLYALNFGHHGLPLRMGLALFTSMVSFMVMKMLDFVADLDCTGPAFDKGICMVITAMGVTIGLSWENAFHECVEVSVEFMVEDKSVIFSFSDDPKVWAFLLSTSIVLTVLPAYRWYIVPTMYQLLEEHEEKISMEEAKEYQSQAMDETSYFAASPAQGLTEQTYMFNEPNGTADLRGSPLVDNGRGCAV